METKLEEKTIIDAEGVKIAISDVPKKKQSRFLRKNKSIYADQLICLIALVGMAVWRSGPRALMICAISVFVAMIGDAIGCKMSKKTYNPKDLSTLVSGLCLALMMPSSIGYGFVAFGAALAMGVKHIFGGKDNYIFNPACLSFAFLVICYPSQMLLYPKLGEYLPLFGNIDPATLSSGMDSYLLKIGTAQALSPLDVLIGNFIGPIGTVHVLVLLVCALCMICRRSLSPIVSLVAFGSFIASSFLFPTYDNISMALVIELISGNLLFGLVFLANDPQTLPKSILGKIYYGLLIGILATTFRHFAKVETSFVFVLLLTNACSVHIDLFADRTIVITKNLVRYLRKALGNFERVKTDVQSGNERSLNDTQEIIVPLMNYNMPAIDSKVIKAKKQRVKPVERKKKDINPVEKKRKKSESKTSGSFFKEIRNAFFSGNANQAKKTKDAAQVKAAAKHKIKQPKKRSDEKSNKSGKKN